MDLCYYKLPPLKLISIVLGVFWKKLWKEVLFNSEVIDSTSPQLEDFLLKNTVQICGALCCSTLVL